MDLQPPDQDMAGTDHHMAGADDLVDLAVGDKQVSGGSGARNEDKVEDEIFE